MSFHNERHKCLEKEKKSKHENLAGKREQLFWGFPPGCVLKVTERAHPIPCLSLFRVLGTGSYDMVHMRSDEGDVRQPSAHPAVLKFTIGQNSEWRPAWLVSDANGRLPPPSCLHGENPISSTPTGKAQGKFLPPEGVRRADESPYRFLQYCIDRTKYTVPCVSLSSLLGSVGHGSCNKKQGFPLQPPSFLPFPAFSCLPTHKRTSDPI